MVKTGVSYDGLDEIQRNINKLKNLVSEEAKDKALNNASKVLKNEIEKSASVIKYPEVEAKAKNNVEIVKNDDEYEVGYYDDLFYLYFHEVGTSAGTYKRQRIKNGETKKHEYVLKNNLSPTPWVRPAIENSKDEVKAEMAKTLRKELGL